MLVLGGYVTDAPNDKQQLEPAVDCVPPGVREATHVLADSGYHSDAAVAAVEADGIVKSAMGFRRFLLRGLKKVNLEWCLVRVACNFRRLATLLAAQKGTDRAPMAPATA